MSTMQICNFYCKTVISLYLVAVVELFLKLTDDLGLRFPAQILLHVFIVVHVLKTIYLLSSGFMLWLPFTIMEKLLLEGIYESPLERISCVCLICKYYCNISVCRFTLMHFLYVSINVL